MGMQAVVGVFQWQWLQAQLGIAVEQADGRAGDVHQQYVAGFQQGVAMGDQ